MQKLAEYLENAHQFERLAAAGGGIPETCGATGRVSSGSEAQNLMLAPFHLQWPILIFELTNFRTRGKIVPWAKPIDRLAPAAGPS
jgi:hypothetical protein